MVLPPLALMFLQVIFVAIKMIIRKINYVTLIIRFSTLVRRSFIIWNFLNKLRKSGAYSTPTKITVSLFLGYMEKDDNTGHELS